MWLVYLFIVEFHVFDIQTYLKLHSIGTNWLKMKGLPVGKLTAISRR